MIFQEPIANDISPQQLRELAEICIRVADYCDKNNQPEQ